MCDMNIEDKQHDDCLQRLIALKAASRLRAADPTLFGSDPETIAEAKGLMGWVQLASNPPIPLAEITSLANQIREEHIEAVVLIGQGGSSQAAMTITKLHEVATAANAANAATASGATQQPVAFRTMDSLSPVFVNHILGASDPAKTIYIVSSKSGSTIEPLMHERVVWRYVAGHLGTAAAGQRFVAITGEGSQLAELAKERGYRLTLPVQEDVGGRFSALTMVTLFPAALVGIDIEAALATAAEIEAQCALDSEENPALLLASFLYSGYLEGRDKFSLIMPPSGQVFGLWIEQMVAESLGKNGIGILPNVEVDASILTTPHADRSVITYAVGEVEGFVESYANIDPSIPQLHRTIDDPIQAFSRFVLWEYATTFLSILLGVFPFDQPDVELTKVITKRLLASDEATSSEDYLEFLPQDSFVCEMRLSKALADYLQKPTGSAPAAVGSEVESASGEADSASGEAESTSSEARHAHCESPSLDHLLRILLGSFEPGDYFSLNAFLPFRGYGRREALERMRNRTAARLGVVSCLEIGPRYLHSTGQLHKGGPNNGVFLILSADEPNDINIPNEGLTLGSGLTLGVLASTQAKADFTALAERGRRVLHVHLLDNDSETLSRFADRFCSAISAVMVQA